MASPLMCKKGGYSNFQGLRKILTIPGIPWDIKQWHVSSFFIILIIYYCSINVFDGLSFLSSWNKNQFAQLYKCYQIPNALHHVLNVSYRVLIFQVLNKTLQNFKTTFSSTTYFSHGRKFPRNLQGCEFEKTPVSTSDTFMTNPAKSRDSFIFLTLILFYYSDEDILN